MIEKPPSIEPKPDVIISLFCNAEYKKYFDRVEKDYLYWDKVKYNAPNGINPEDFWIAVKMQRLSNAISFGKYVFSYKINDYMQQYLHEFDMNFGGTLSSDNIITERTKQYYLLSSIMEEAIASSQMEGASTTRKVAKEMLRKQQKPKDASQQMILNNYRTIRFLSEKKDSPLSKELLLEIHRKISEKTLDNPEDVGNFRTTNDIVVSNKLTGEVAHYPPDCDEIELIIEQLCDFANNDKTFVHPIIKAIIIHFMISFLHPFVDGNGRTARSLFYWYMLKKGYWLTEFLSISRIIYSTKSKYEKVFLYTEQDDYNLGYFINYNLVVLNKAYKELKAYLDRKSKEHSALFEFKNVTGINERQAKILKIATKKPENIFICKDLETELGVSVKTIRADLEGLVKKDLLKTIHLNKRLTGYIRTDDFEDKLKEFSGN
ncbi:Fic family protein [Treponema sp. Marseille-Q3903]|uniref:Fic family protein n=1 Tax=Treponema sp. Marseille-Q3903 TaxID=2766703 RepID=UPI0016528355|nr:Fic family protein [Treponema sp. Marseille-Q3903]MBC6713331.1 Fic family protein [Treponema sp. Marseille-Q3903]